ncbi:unnamed protein product, partial [marine sediment metagenome]
MKKAVFLDRDGVINCERGEYNYRIENFTINEGVIECLKNFQKAGFILIIISNQGGIAKGIYKKENIEQVHRYLVEVFEKQGIFLTEIYYCPHHSDIENCLCRKPDSLLIEKSIARFKINPSESFFIGDKETDVIAAKKAGLNPVMIKPNENLLKYLPEI